MKTFNLITLASILILQAHSVLADNTRALVQPIINKSIVSSPAKTLVKPKIVMQTNKAVGIRNGGVSANPPSHPIKQKVNLPHRLATQDLGRKNLTISVEYERDVCALTESPLDPDLFNARCDLIIKVKNHGSSTTSETNVIQINMSYSDKNGTHKLLRFIPALAANEEKRLVIRSGLIHSFKRAASFTAVVDRPQNVAETNENDNTAVFWLGL